MGWVADKRMLGGRARYNRQQKVRREMRRIITAECLRAGMTNVAAIMAVVRERDPSLPCSSASIYRDKSYWEQRWFTESRCPECGSQLAILSSDVPTEL